MTSTSWEEFKKLMDLSHEDEFDFQSAIQIHSLEDYNPTKFSEWPVYMLKEIMSLSDDILRMPDGIRERQNHSKKNDQPSDTKILAQMFHTNQSCPHPMDIFLYLFSVCDKVFRQTFCSHVAKCQLTLPLITMDPILQSLNFYNFAFGTLTKDYYSTNVDSAIKESKSFSVNEEKLPIVSFIRVGDCAYSLKSQILNGILGMNHSYFFNSTCRDNVKNAYFFRGSIEIGWFLPGKKKEFIEKPFVILNLRGNACHLQTQVNFLSKVSTLMCVFIPCNILNNEIEKTILDIKKDYEDKLLYLLYESPNNIQTSSFLPEYLAKTEQKLILNDGNAKNYAIILTREIKALIDVNIPNLSLTNCTDIARQHEITVDCDNDEILNVSTNKIQDILEILNSSINSFNLQGKIALAEIKNRYLPLQGAQWKKWAESNRKFLLIKSDISGKTLDESKKELGENMKNARKEQFRLLKNPSDLLNILLELIPSEIPSSINDAIIITWKVLENELNTISLEFLPILHQKYEKFLRDSSSSEANECVNYKQELLKTSMDIINSSFGIEHFFREFGQVYETCAKYKNMQSKLCKNWNIKNMPQLIAKLILAGHSFEIMDGDVNHVPIEWVKKVLECLAKFIGSDKKLFVLSILGTQSSGKSTLLNTMFGVNFAVSSGRCTRGVFMQVIPINEELAKSTLGYDYLVLLDTEGLRAKEQIGPNYRFDNELATFVIGLGDLTLVNMRSEMYTEIEDIIQVTVMALIRMNISIKLRPKCIFVHQNVPCPHANNNLKHIKAELIQTLDKMTVIAAEREKMDKINRFCDVIEFDPNSDVFYFPSLNDGVPPIARVSSDYSSCARELKYKILTISRGHTTFQSLNDWIFKISTIWESVLKENFAFSYKNILQIHCRFELDSALCNWSSDYSHAMLADKSEKIHFLLNTSNDPNDIDSELSKIKSEILKLSEGTLKEAQNILMENFFTKHIYASIFFQWENLAETHFRTLRIKEKKRNLSDCEQVVNIQKEKFRMDRAFTEYSKKLVSQTVTYFKDIRRNNSFCDGTPIQPLFIEKFNQSLNDWSSGFMLNCMLQSNVVYDCQHAIIDSPFLQSMYIISDKIDRLTKLDEYREFGRRNFSYKDKPYYNIFKAENRHRFLGNLFNSDKKLAMNSFLQNLQKISDKVQTFLNESILQKLEYSSECYSLLINYIYHEIEKINKEQRKNIEFCIELSNDFIFDYIFYKCCNAITKFERLQEVLQRLERVFQQIFAILL